MSIWLAAIFSAALAPVSVLADAETAGFRPERVVYSDAGTAAKGMSKRLAQEFARAVSRTVGRECPAVRETKSVSCAPGTIYVGNTLAAKAAGLDAGALPALGYRLTITNGAAYVLARTATAAAYGISDFAARFLDYRFITFDGDDPFTFSPELALGDADVTEIPEIYYRRVYAIDKYRKFPDLKRDWPMRHMLFKTELIEDEVDPFERLSKCVHSCHSQFDYVPPEIYFRDHPEYYSLGKDGKRHGVRNRRSHLCLTHPDVEKIVWSNLVAFIERDRKQFPVDYPRIYDFSQMDAAPDFCRCENCSKVAAKYDAKGGRTDGGDAGIQLEFVNRIARRLKTIYPDVRLRIFAYVSTEVPPKPGTIRPEDNVIIWICDLYSTSDHEVPITHPANAPRLKILRDWAKLTSNIEIWDYMLYGDLPNLKGGHGDFPEVNVDAIAADARLFRDIGAKRMFMECEYRDQPFHELTIHAMGRLYFNPDEDVENIVADYCRVYGAAAGKMREAIDLIRRLQLSSPANATENFRWHRRDLAWLTLENLERIRSLFKAAEALADTPGAKRRVAHALRSVENKLRLVRKSAVGEAEYLFTCNDFNRANLCKIIDDPDATGGKAIEILHRDAKDVKKPVKPELPLLMGVYNWDTKGNSTFKFMPEESAEYRWYKLGEVELPPSPTIWLSKDWGFTIDLRSCYANGDGLPDDYNRFEIFASAKFTGGRLFFDQVRMVRIAAKKTSGKTTEKGANR